MWVAFLFVLCYNIPMKKSGLITHTGGFKRENKEAKVDFTLIPTDVLTKVALHFTRGAKVHGRDNWKKAQDITTFKQSAFRHLIAVLEDNQDEPHAEALIWNMMCYLWHTNSENPK